ncbi:MAG: FAD-dependent oxidoreductase [Acidobacteriota bacterium]|nr:MAG: FAD-dependent oxidoreductase [Acidobacteriota bacterium]
MFHHDVLIIGGGPAGMSALIWCHSLGLRAVAFERVLEPGGQMLSMYHQIPDYPGLPLMTGREMRDRFLEHVTALGLDLRTGCRIDEVRLSGKRLICNGDEHHGRAVIIATGARRRGLELPEEARFAASGISYSATRDHSLYAGKRVAVVGGGDSAFENALILARVCPEVWLIHRSDRFRARREWLDQATRNPAIRILTFQTVTGIEGARTVERLILTDSRDGARRAIEVEALFIKIGIAPNTEVLRGQIDLDQDGYLIVDSAQRTSVDMVYAAGDVCRPVCLSVATAVGHGAVAAKDISERVNRRDAEEAEN